MVSVLLVDDDASLRETFADALGQAGMSVSNADNGATALAMVEAGGFDIVVTDLFMPESDGLELLMGMQRENLEIPVIVMTGGPGGGFGSGGQLTDSCVGAAKVLGAVRTLQKPLRPSVLIREIEALVPSREA